MQKNQLKSVESACYFFLFPLNLMTLRVSDSSGALFSKGIFLAFTKKAGTDSTTRSFYVGTRPNKNKILV
jgi:hypothetical protein